MQTTRWVNARLRASAGVAALVASGCALAAGVFLGSNKLVAAKDDAPAITIDYPLNGSVFPPEMEAPTFCRWQSGFNA